MKNSIKQKHKLYQKFLFDQTPHNEMLYKAYKNKLKALIRKSEINYYQNILSDRKNNIKDMWKHLGFLLNPNKNNSQNKKSVSKLNINGKTITKDKNIANAFNEYFANVGSNLANKIIQDQPLKSCYRNYFSLTNKHRRNLKEKNGTDPFKTSIIKSIKNEITEALVIIFNKSLEQGNFPNLLKIAKVIPIYKGGDNDNPVNYRPISLLSIFDKIFEKIVYNRLQSFITKSKVLYKFQYGFRKNHATAYALIDVMEYIYNSLDEGKYVFGIFIDLKMAFDTVSHHILLNKLKHYGIRGIALNWFTSYLKNRKQFISVNNINSDIYNLNQLGVPERSVLGPLLFLIFINDIHNALSKIIIKLFADDTNCFLSKSDFNELKSVAQCELTSLMHWIQANKLTINFHPKKSSYCVFKPASKNLPSTYKGVKIGNNTLSYKESTTYPGLILDSKLTWDLQIKETKKKITNYCSIFSKVRHFLTKRCRLELYNAVIFSRLNYEIEIYLNVTKVTPKNYYPPRTDSSKSSRLNHFSQI